MFVDTLDELNWMDEESKRKAQEKVGELQPRWRKSPGGREVPGKSPGNRRPRGLELGSTVTGLPTTHTEPHLHVWFCKLIEGTCLLSPY